MPNQIPNTLPGGPVNSLPGFAVSYIYYFRGASTDEQWYYASDLLGFGYGSSSTLLVYFRGAKDVNAVDTVTITLLAGTDHKDAAEYLLNAPVYQQVAPTYHHIIRVTGLDKFRTEFVSATISYGTCCSGGGSGTMSNWILSDGSTTQQIDNAETVTFADGTFINNVVSATNTVTTDLSATGTASGTTFLRGDNTWAVPANTTYTAGDGLDLSGTEFSTDLKANGGLVIESTELALDLGASSITGTLDETDGGTGLTSYTTGDILYASGSNTLAKLAVGSNTNVLTLAGGVPTWAAAPATGAAFSFVYINTPAGSFPTADAAADTLALKSVANTSAVTSSSVHITGDSSLDSVDFQVRKFESFVITLTDENRVMTTGTKYRFRMPYDFILADYGSSGGACQHPVKLHVNEPPASGDPGVLRVNIYKNTNSTSAPSWTSIFTGTSGQPQIEATEYTSVTATQQSEFTNGSGGTSATYELNCDDELKFEVDLCSGDERGLKVILVGYQKNCQG